MVKQQGRFVEYLMSNKPWDFFMVVCRSTDQIQHYYWRFMDSNHPYHPQSVSPKLKNAVVDIYKDLDSLVGEIRDRVGPGTHIVVMSDHGHGPDGDRAIYINKWLRSKGFLSFRQEEKGLFRHFMHQEMFSQSVDRLKKNFPRGLKDFVLKRFPSVRDRVETMLSFNDIDFDRTLAYSEDVRGNVWINLKGRQPKGTVGQDKYDEIREELIRLLKELRDPQTGKRMTDKVFRREDLYSGELVSRAPDIVFTQPEDRYTYMLRRSRTDRNLDVWVETIPASEIGVWPTSSHTLDGIFCLSGEHINRGKWVHGARIIDLAPTILYLMGLPIPDDMDGQVIVDAIEPCFMEKCPPEGASAKPEAAMNAAPPHQSYTEEEQVEVQKRLRDLGYIE
jgi:predicted AlkP superfamily phosphohydrolase/phosphomutase